MLVARVPALLALMRAAVPDLYGAFVSAWLQRSGLGEAQAMRSLYAGLEAANFSTDVLGSDPGHLAVLPVRGVKWSDWGEPTRVLRTLSAVGIHPTWAESPPSTVPAMAGGSR